MKKNVRALIMTPVLFLLVLLTFAFIFIPLPAQAQDISSSTPITSTDNVKKNNKDGHVVFIMTSYLQWNSLNDYNTPKLRDFAASGAIGNMIPLAVNGPSCPINSWLTLNAGTRLSKENLAPSYTCEVPPVIKGTYLGNYLYDSRPRILQTYTLLTQTKLSDYGTLDQTFTHNGLTTHSIGTGAAYVLTTPTDTYSYAWEEAPADDAQLGQTVAVSARKNNLTVVDADAAQVLTDKDLPDFSGEKNPDEAKSEYIEDFYNAQSQKNAKRVEAILEEIPDGTRVVLVSLLNFETRKPQITAMGDIGDTSSAFEPIKPGLIYSPSMQREGAVQLIDFDPTILSWFSISRPDSIRGSVLVDEAVSDSQSCDADQPCFTDRINTLTDDALHLELIRGINARFTYVFHLFASFFFFGTILLTAKPLWKRTLGRRVELRLLWKLIGYTLSAFPLSAILTDLYPWWRFEHPLIGYALMSWICAGLLGLLALASSRLHRLTPLFVILVPTALFVTIDTATGSKAMADSAMGFHTLVAARFYGLGNEAYTLLAASSLFVLTFLGMWLKERLKQAGKTSFVARTVTISVVGVLGFIVAAIDALPLYGADFGGALSYIPALLVLLIILSETKIRLRGALLITGATVVLAMLIAFTDWLRPPSSRTHLGNFFQSILDGELFTVLQNKLEMNLHLLMVSNYTSIAIRGILLMFIVLLPALSVHKIRSRSAALSLEQPVEDKVSATRLSSIWLWTKNIVTTVKNRISGFYTRHWGWIFPRNAEDAATRRWPALKIAFIVELVVFILAFALNDSGILLPAIAMLLLLPMFTSWTVDELAAATTEED